MKTLVKISIALVVISFLLAGAIYPFLPAKIASHWNYQGEVNGYMSRWTVFLMPTISLILILLFMSLPKMDPLKDNYKYFSKYYDGLILVLTLFLIYINIITILFNFGYKFNFVYSILPAFSILFYYLGLLIENAKRNWFVGIRTPWTLYDEKIWMKTHHLGGKLFKLSALLALVGLALPKQAFWFMIVPIMLSSIIVVVYSYFLFKKSR